MSTVDLEIPTEPSSSPSPENTPAEKVEAVSSGTPKDLAFWLVFLAICASTFLSALEVTSVSTALPTIVDALHGSEFTWVGSSYTLASTSILPFSGSMANAFGRRPVMLAGLALFALGSALCGSAQSMEWLIAARTVQGLGGGIILTLTEILVADLVPLSERGTYIGIIGMVFAIASAVGPPVGGALSQSGAWRWLFYLNLPLAAVAMVLVTFFLRMKLPPGTFREKLGSIDWLGNFIIMAASTAVVLGLTWGGVKYPWDSSKVLVPLVVGLVGIIVFLLYESTCSKDPVVPFVLLSNRTSLSGFLATFLHGIVSTAITFYLPVYFQACKQSSPLRSGIQLFGMAFTIAPGAVAAGASVAVFKIYRPQNYVAWILSTIGCGLLSTLKADSGAGKWIGFQIISGLGVGMLYATTTFPILAPVPIQRNAQALALLTYFRSFAQVWGITIGSTALQNGLKSRLPASFLASIPGGLEITYALIPQIPTLPEPLRTEVQVAFAGSLQVVWQILIGIAGAGFLSVLLMKELPMHEVTDDQWAMDGKEDVNDVLTDEKDQASVRV